MAAAKKIFNENKTAGNTLHSLLENISSKQFGSVTYEYYKYYISYLNQNDDIDDAKFYHLKKFLNENTSSNETLNFMIRTLEKNRILSKDDKYEKNSSRINYLERVINKNFISINTYMSDYDKTIFDKFYELLYRKNNITFYEEVVFVILINTLEERGYIRIADSAEENVNNDMFKFS